MACPFGALPAYCSVPDAIIPAVTFGQAFFRRALHWLQNMTCAAPVMQPVLEVLCAGLSAGPSINQLFPFRLFIPLLIARASTWNAGRN